MLRLRSLHSRRLSALIHAAGVGLLTLGLFFNRVVPVAAQDASAPKINMKAEPTKQKPVISPNLKEELAKFKPVRMPFDASQLTPRETQMIGKLVKACQALESIYWRQSDPEGLELYQSLAASRAPIDTELRRFLRINGSRFDLIDDDKPFVGTTPRPPGRGFFPADLTRKEFDAYVAAHPDQKAALYDPFTVVRRKGSALEAIPYHVAYKEWVDPAATALREAADLSDDAAFAKFLRMRADSLQSDQYFDSDIAWVSLVNPKFDVIFAPYET
jgi:hypothetical protein